MVEVGDWVTQYSVGYWKVVDIKPKYADSDYAFQGYSHRKGDLIGSWVLMKKAFTPKMKFRIDCECMDSYWCKPVSQEVLQQIEEYFQAHEDQRRKFLETPYTDRLVVSNAWLNMTDEQAERFQSMLTTVPIPFTWPMLRAIMAAHGMTGFLSESPCTHILNMLSHIWELDENFDSIYHYFKLTKLD